VTHSALVLAKNVQFWKIRMLGWVCIGPCALLSSLRCRHNG